MISKSQTINSTSGPRVLLSPSVRPPVHAIFFTALQPTILNRSWWYMVPQMNLLGWSLLLMGYPCSFLRILLNYILWIHTDKCLISGSLSLYHPQYFTGHVWYSYWPQVEHDICWLLCLCVNFPKSCRILKSLEFLFSSWVIILLLGPGKLMVPALWDIFLILRAMCFTNMQIFSLVAQNQ